MPRYLISIEFIPRTLNLTLLSIATGRGVQPLLLNEHDVKYLIGGGWALEVNGGRTRHLKSGFR